MYIIDNKCVCFWYYTWIKDNYEKNAIVKNSCQFTLLLINVFAFNVIHELYTNMNSNAKNK